MMMSELGSLEAKADDFYGDDERPGSLRFLDRTPLMCHARRTLARVPLHRDHGIVILLSWLPEVREAKQVASHMTVKQMHQSGQYKSPPLHLPYGWWIAPMIGFGMAIWHWIISAFLAILN